MIYNRNSPWLDRSLKLAPLFEPLLSPIATNIAGKAGKRRKTDGIANIETALSVILANLLQQSALAPSSGLRIDLSNDGYPKGTLNPHCLGIRAIRKVMEYLKSSDPPLIAKRGGNFDKERGKGYTTEILANNVLINKLLLHLRELKISDKNLIDIYNYPITRNTFDLNTYAIYHHIIFERADLPIIRLRNASSKEGKCFVDFDRTPETDIMEERLASYNSFLASHGCLNLFATDDEMKELLGKADESIDDFGYIDADDRLIDLISGNKLYRVFNDGRFDHGGRFYGGWWQNVPSSYRRLITINGLPTMEIDFSGMQLAMLYARVGQQLEGDAYTVKGIGSEFRPLIKTATFKLINAEGNIRLPANAVLPKDVSWKDLQEAIIERHKPIAKFFHSGEGIRLQRLDADIAEDVILRMMDKGILALPIHDSFIVTEDHADLLADVMKDAYQRKMGGYTIAIKPSQSLIDGLLAGRDGLNTDERRVLGLELFQAKKEEPEYQSFRLREEWLNRKAFAVKGLDSNETSDRQADSRPDSKFSSSGPRVETSHSARTTHRNPIKRLWDRFMGQREAV